MICTVYVPPEIVAVQILIASRADATVLFSANTDHNASLDIAQLIHACLHLVTADIFQTNFAMAMLAPAVLSA